MVSACCVLACRRADIEDLSNALREPAWLRDRRLLAFDRFERMPMPTHADEAWRRTDLSRLSFEGYEPAREPSLALDPLPPEAAGQGVVFTDLAAAVREHESLLRDHLLTTVTPDDSKFVALHAALMTEAVFLFVPPGVQVDVPLRARIRHPAAEAAIFPHTLVLAGKGSRVRLIEEATSAANGASPGLALGVAEVVVGEGASVEHAQINQYGHGVVHLSAHRARLQRDARYHALLVGMGGHLTKAAFETLLLGPGADSRISGLVLGGGDQSFEYHTLQDHRAPHTTSALLFKVALQDRARSVYSGLLRMGRTARQADATQTNRNLLLSPRTKAESIPKLEIEVNDVRCSHAAATSSVDDEQVYYLQSRGLDRAEAVHMIVEGFFEEVLAGFPSEDLQQRVRDDLRSRLAREVA